MSDGGVALGVEFEDRISPALASLARKIVKLDPVLDEVGASNVAETQHRFETATGPTGAKWKGLSALTLKRRGPGAKVLRAKGELFDSITHQVNPSAVRIGTNRRYARVHQLGLSDRNIPARPYLGVSDEGRKEITEIFKAHLVLEAKS